jgi:hypothetical protein
VGGAEGALVVSKIFMLACHDCRTALWVGRCPAGSTFREGGSLFEPTAVADGLSTFFGDHERHHLEFADEEDRGILSYELKDIDGALVWKGSCSVG